MKTVSEFAAAIGVSRQAVRDKIKKLGLQSSLQSNCKGFAIDEAAEAALTKAFENNFAKSVQSCAKSLQSETTNTDRLIDMLQNELDLKNRQIDELHARLADTTAALVAAQQTASTAQALHAGTMKQLVDGSTDGEASADERGGATPKRGIFGLFRKK